MFVAIFLSGLARLGWNISVDTLRFRAGVLHVLSRAPIEHLPLPSFEDYHYFSAWSCRSPPARPHTERSIDSAVGEPETQVENARPRRLNSTFRRALFALSHEVQGVKHCFGSDGHIGSDHTASHGVVIGDRKGDASPLSCAKASVPGVQLTELLRNSTGSDPFPGVRVPHITPSKGLPRLSGICVAGYALAKAAR